MLQLSAAILGLCALFSATACAQAVLPLPTSETVLLGRFAQGPLNLPLWLGQSEFQSTFGSTNPAAWPAEIQARQFFANGGTALYVNRVADSGSLHDALMGDANGLTGLHAVEPLSNARLLIAPELSILDSGGFASAFAAFRNFCDDRKIFFIVDPAPGLTSVAKFTNWANARLTGNARICAIYYPYLQFQIDGADLTVPASGAMAAIYAQNDIADGIWDSPAGTSLTLVAANTSPVLTAGESDSMNALHLNAIRVFGGIGVVPWGARTLDKLDSDNRFIPVVRTHDWIRSSLERSLSFAATNDNGVALWTQLRASTENFLQSLFTQGAFAGMTPNQAYFVRCDSTTTTATDIAQHRVNLLYGIAPIQPAEFVISTITLRTYDPSREPNRPVLRATLSQGQLHLSYPIEPGFNYELQSVMNDVSGGWDGVGDTVVGDGAWFRSAESASTSNGFYRLRITDGR